MQKIYYELQNIPISSLSVTVFTRLIELICVYDDPEKSERPHFYDNFILSNYLVLKNQNTIVVF